MNADSNPYSPPAAESKNRVDLPSRKSRLAIAIGIAIVGLCVGSYLSAELLHVWFPDQPRSAGIVGGNTIAAILVSPIAMTLGILPSLGFYGPFHGIGVLLGMVLSIVSTVQIYRSGRSAWIAASFFGFVLWSHNNYLAFNALMSV